MYQQEILKNQKNSYLIKKIKIKLNKSQLNLKLHNNLKKILK